MIDFKCPLCGTVVALSDDGTESDCPKCGLVSLAVGPTDGFVPERMRNRAAQGMPVIAEIGRPGELTLADAERVAKMTANTVASLAPDVGIYFSIGGFNNDKRELWDIVEVRAFVLRFVYHITRLGVPLTRFHPESQGLARACYVRSLGMPVDVTPRSDPMQS
jgi:hypothetical protein